MTVAQLTDVMNTWQDRRVLVLGDAMLDVEIHGSYRGPSPEGGGPVLQEQKILRFPGGAANVAMNLQALGARVWLLSPIGQDETGQWLKERLVEEKISWIPSYYPCRNSWLTTTTKTRIYRDAREMLCRVDRDAHLIMSPELVCKVVDDQQFDLVVLSDYQKGAFSQNPASYLARLRTQGVLVTANPKPHLAPQLKGIDLISVNEGEYEALAEYNESHDALRRRLQVRFLLKTRGRNGIEVSLGPDHVFQSSGYRLTSGDVVGAGDSTFAAASLALTVTDDPKLVAALANAAGAAKVLKQGTRPVTTFDVAGMLTRRPSLE